MKTTDFTGTYDYEQDEADHAADYILEDIYCGYLAHHEISARIEKERMHWKKCIPETFEDWDRHFLAAISKGMAHALKGPA